MIPLCDETRKFFGPLKDPIQDRDRIEVGLLDDGDFICDFYSNNVDRQNKRFRGLATYGMIELTNRLPQRKQLSGAIATGMLSPYRVGSSDCNVELISHHVPYEQIIFKDANAETTWKMILAKSQLADDCARLIADFKNNKVVPQHDYELNADKPLADYQQIALLAQQSSTGFGYFMEQGTGKTAPTIAAICNSARRYKDAGNIGLYKAIIVCPPNLRTNWLTEFETFATRPGRVTVLKGTSYTRVKLLCDAFTLENSEGLYFSVILCGYKMLWNTWESLRMLEWDLAVLDEGHAIKDAKATQSKACIELRDNSKQRLILTGTPIANTPLDLYNLLEFMERGGSGFTNFADFRKFYGVFTENADHREILVGCANLPFLQERLARKSYFISKKEALPNLPDKVYDILEVEMAPAQTDAYVKLSRELAISIDAQLANSNLQRSMMVQNILTQLLRLSQITSGFASWDELVGLDGECLQPKFVEYFYPNPKIEAILQLLAEKDATEKTIVWANWIPDIDYLEAACQQNGIDCCVFRGLHKGYTDEDRQESVRRFNEDRNCKVFIGTAGSGGSGLNLLGYPAHAGQDYETDCTHIIYFSQDWSSIKRSQSEDRAHRRGTRRTVRYTTIVVPDSIDTQIHKKVTHKREVALEVSDLREILNSAIIKV